MTKTCWVGALAAVCLSSLAGHAADEKQRTIEYLRTLQAADGGFLPTSAEQANGKRVASSLRATSAALRALRHQGGEARDRNAAARFVAACFDKSAGAFSDQPRSRPDVNATAVGLMAVEELHMPMDRYKVAASYLGLHAQTFEEIRIAAAGLEAAGTRPPKATRWIG